MNVSIIGDLVKSRDMVDRLDVHSKLSKVLDEVNEKFDQELSKYFQITLGDEFQGLLNSPVCILDILYYIKSRMHPVIIRFGIGAGEISFTDDNKMSALGSEGEAWWFARDAIKELESNKYKDDKYNIRIKMNSKIDSSINSFFELFSEIESNWTTRQWDIFSYIITNYGLEVDFTKNELADKLRIKPSTLSNHLSAIGYNPYVNAINALKKLLNINILD